MSQREKMRPADWVVVTSCSILMLSVFLRWFHCSLNNMPTGKTVNIPLSGWEETKLSAFIIVFALVGIALIIFIKGRPHRLAEKLPYQIIVTALGFCSLVIVIIKLFLHEDDLGLSYGIFVAIASSIAVIIGGIMLAREGANRKKDEHLV